MKKVATFVLLMVITLATLCTATDAQVTNGMQAATTTNGTHYTLFTIVTDVDTTEDVVTCEDATGNLWEFYGTDNRQVGECVYLLMETNGTETIFDDSVTDVQSSAWTLTH